MQKKGIARDQVLKRVEQAFARHRRHNRGRASYSKPLRALALSAVATGIVPSKVARAAGVSQQSLANWRGTSSEVEMPRELVLVSEPSVTPKAAVIMKSPSDSASACIRLCSGVSIDVPISALTPSLLAVLNGGGQ